MAQFISVYQKRKTNDEIRTIVRDIRGYRVEEWSDFTESVKKG